MPDSTINLALALELAQQIHESVVQIAAVGRARNLIDMIDRASLRLIVLIAEGQYLFPSASGRGRLEGAAVACARTVSLVESARRIKVLSDSNAAELSSLAARVQSLMRGLCDDPVEVERKLDGSSTDGNDAVGVASGATLGAAQRATIETNGRTPRNGNGDRRRAGPLKPS